MEGMIDHGAAGIGHDSPAPIFLRDPVADLDPSIKPVDLMSADPANQFIARPDARGETVVARKLLQRGLDEIERVFYLSGHINPGQPLPEIGPLAIDYREHFGRMPFLHELQIH